MGLLIIGIAFTFIISIIYIMVILSSEIEASYDTIQTTDGTKIVKVVRGNVKRNGILGIIAVTLAGISYFIAPILFKSPIMIVTEKMSILVN